MMLNGGEYAGVRILQPATIARWTAKQERRSSRALGWDTPSGNSSAGRYFSARSFGHTGFTGTSIWIDPERSLFVILLTNRVNPTRANTRHEPLRRAIADATQRAITDAPLRMWLPSTR
jgi:CubicO group peptidase (beta-lactamase class C family)